MAREIDSPADELRDAGARAKRAAKAAIDPKKKESPKIRRKLLILRMSFPERFIRTV
jgi:hypothetical protein